MLTVFGIARLGNAMLVHVLCNVQNYAMLRYCTFSSLYRTTQCYATARSMQCTELRDATLTGVGNGVGGLVGAGGCQSSLDLHTYVMIR